MQYYNFLALLGLFLLVTVPTNANPTCNTVGRFLQPTTQDASRAMTEFWVSCTGATGTPFLPAGGLECKELIDNGKVRIQVCPPSPKPIEAWRNGVWYECMEIRTALMEIFARCQVDGRVGGSMKLGDHKRGYVTMTRPVALGPK